MFKFKRKIKEPKPEKLKTPAEIVDTLIAMRDCGIREWAFEWDGIVLGHISKRKMLKICSRYGKVRRVWKGFRIKFTY
jgi:hypothetical protein